MFIVKGSRLTALIAVIVFYGTIFDAFSASFLDDFSADTSANYTDQNTYGSGSASFNISDGTLNVIGAGGTTYDVFHNDARLEVGETVRIDFVSNSGTNDIYFTVSTINKGPNKGGSGIRFLYQPGAMKAIVYDGSSATTTYPAATITYLYISRDTDTTYSYGYDNTELASGVTISGTAGVGLYVGVETYGTGTRVFDNFLIGVPSELPVINSFSSSVSQIDTAGDITFTWDVSNAESVTLNGVDVTGQSPYTTTVSQSGDYTLEATNSGGLKVSSSTYITVGEVFSIAVVTDPQYADTDPRGPRSPREGLPRLRHAVSEWNKRDLDWGILLGDAIDWDDVNYSDIGGTPALPALPEPLLADPNGTHDWNQTDDILGAFRELNVPQYLVLGNHEFYVPDKDVDGLSKPYSVYRKFGFNDKGYYNYRHKGFRFVVLEIDWRFLNHDAHDPDGDYAVAKAYYEDFSDWGTSWWNGAISIEQRLWLMDLLDESNKMGEKVVIFAHDPLETTANTGHDIFNKHEMIDILNGYPNVVIWMDGHDHGGGYELQGGRHHLNLKGLQNTANADAWYQLDFSQDQISVFKAENITTPERVLDIRATSPSLSAPTGFAVTASGNDAVLSWEQEPAGTTSVIIERRHVTTLRAELPSTAKTLAWTIIHTDTALTSQTYTDTALTNNVSEYKYRIRFLDGQQGSVYSNAIKVGEEQNNAPTFSNESISLGTIDAHSPYSGDISSYATDTDNDSMTFSKRFGPNWLTVASDGTLSGTPSNDYVGSSAYVIEVKDSKGGVSNATFNFTIEYVPKTTAIDDEFSIKSNSMLEGDVKKNDIDAENINAMVVAEQGPEHGVLDLNPDGTFTYTPDSDFSGVDTFTYELEGSQTTAVVTISIKGELAKYQFTEISDSTGNHGAITISGAAELVGGRLNITADGGSASLPSLGITTNTITMATWVKPDENTSYTDYTGIIYSRDGTSSGLRVRSNGDLSYDWGGSNWGYTQSDCTLVKGVWNFVVLVISPDKVNFYSATDEQVDLATNERIKSHSPIALGVIHIGRDNAVPTTRQDNRTLVGSFDETRIWNYSLSAPELEELFDNEKTTLTPAIGITVTQTGTDLRWSVEDEIGIKQYNITVDGTTRVVMFDPDANGSYSITLDSDAPATITVVDHSGFSQTFIPSDGNIVQAVYNLQEGWNLIAMPGKNADTSVIDSVLWGWNGASYEQVKTVEVGKAVWVYSKVEKQVIISATKEKSELILNPGWNMVGPTENIKIPDEAHTVFGWNDKYQNVANKEGILLQGIGYWIFTKKSL